MPMAGAEARGAKVEERAEAAEKKPEHIPHLVGNIIYGFLAFVFKIAFRYSCEGIENLRKFQGGKSALIVCNHTSYLDPVFLYLTGRSPQWIRFVARDNLFANFKGLAGQVLSRVGAFPIKRDTADRTAIKRATHMLKSGELVGIFPEGTRRGRGTAEMALHGGAAFIARMAKVPIIPSTVRNADKVKTKDHKFIRFPHISVEYGKPVYLEDFDFLPKEDRLDGFAWYTMRESYAMFYRINREEVDMKALFPESRDFSEAFAGKDLSRTEN